MSEPITRPYWWPKLFDAAECQRCREDYPEAEGMSDEEIREEYNDGCKYQQTWDDVGDAYEDYEPLADAFLATQAALRKLVEQANYLTPCGDDLRYDCCDASIEKGHADHCTLFAAIAEAERLLK